MFFILVKIKIIRYLIYFIVKKVLIILILIKMSVKLVNRIFSVLKKINSVNYENLIFLEILCEGQQYKIVIQLENLSIQQCIYNAVHT